MKQEPKDFKSTLRILGADEFDLLLPETKVIAKSTHPDEVIVGIVYGRYKQGNAEHTSGRGVLVATDRRILLLDKKPIFLKCDELSYNVVSGINYSKAGIGGTITLHSRTGDITIRTYNVKCGDTFVKAIEKRCLNKPTEASVQPI